MRFISKIPALKVYIKPRRTARDPITNEVLEVDPSVVARFTKCMFSSEEKIYVLGLLRKFAFAKENGIAPTFTVHPEDMQEAEELMKKINPEIAETFVKKGGVLEKVETQQAMNDQTQATLNTLLDTVAKLAETVAEMKAEGAKKKGGKPPKQIDS